MHFAPGWPRVQAICDFVASPHRVRVRACPRHADRLGGLSGAPGVCRDFAHLAVALLPGAEHSGALLHGLSRRRRHVAAVPLGWISRPGSRPTCDGRWHIFDPRNNVPRIGRVLIARGRDAADVAISDTFGPNTLRGFRVWTERGGRRALLAAGDLPPGTTDHEADRESKCCARRSQATLGRGYALF